MTWKKREEYWRWKGTNRERIGAVRGGRGLGLGEEGDQPKVSIYENAIRTLANL